MKYFYTLLGVEPTASSDAIRQAYLARMRVVHPDRFDPTTEARAWRDANTMAAEVNEAYATLKDAQSRAQYDARRVTSGFHSGPRSTGNDTHSHDRTPPQDAARGMKVPADIKSGYTTFDQLTPRAQETILARQADRITPQHRIRISGIAPTYLLFMLVAASWFGWLAIAITLPTWNETEWMIFLGIAGAAGLVAGAATRHILRWHSSPLKNNFFVTPLYIIETNLERIQFWPLWEIIDINATHHHTNGRYDNTELRLRLRSEWRSWRISSKQEFDVLMQLLDSFRSQLGQHSRAGDWEYFSTHDDFQGMGDNDRVAAPPPRINWFVTALPGLVFLVALIISGGLNRADAPNRWFYHESQPPEVAKLPTSLSSLQTPAILAPLEDAAIPPAEAIPMNPAAVPIPSTYTVRQGDSLAKIAADVGIDIEELIRANPSITSPDLLLVGAELNIPTTKRNTAPISMAESSPSVPKPEPRIPLDLKVDESSQVSSPTKQAVHLPQPLPMHGSVTRYSTAEAIAPLSIKTSLGSGYYYVKLVAWPSGKPELVVFVHGGRDVSVEVPLGEYRMKYANGTDWYGENYLFGERTTYSEAESLFAFTVEGNQISGYTVELILQEQGNLVTNSIPAQAF